MNEATGVFMMGFKAKQLLALVMATMLSVVSLPVMAVFALGGPTLTWLADTPDIPTAETRGFYMGGLMKGNTYAWGNCTWWAYAMRQWAGIPIPSSWGNANTWDDNAEREGYTVNRVPAVGAIFQNDADGGGYGHVAYVISVSPVDGQWTISEMNAPTLNVVSTRTFPRSAAVLYKFIHGKTGDASWTATSLSAMPH